MPPVVDPHNLYSETGADHVSPEVARDPPRVYVPSLGADRVYVIDPALRQVIESFPVGLEPHHIVPSWDLKTLWVTSTGLRGAEGSLTPIDPKTGRPGAPVAVADPYNLYFTPDGKSAVAVAERLRRLDFRDPHTMALQYSIPTPQCGGINHADFSIDGKYAIFTCEFSGGLVKIDIANRTVVGRLPLSRGGMPQDIRVSPDGTVFYVADMMANGVFLVDGDRFAEIGFIPTGPARRTLSKPRRHQALCREPRLRRPPHGAGQRVGHRFRDPLGRRQLADTGRRQPRHGKCQRRRENLMAVRPLPRRRLRDRYDHGSGGQNPARQGAAWLTVWPQPGRYSLGHTGNMR